MDKSLKPIFLSLLLGFILLSGASFAQQKPLLERQVTVTFEQKPVSSVLDQVAAQAAFVFSYSSSAIDVARLVSGNFENQTVREVLEGVFQGEVHYKERGNYIILTPAPVSKKEVTVSGYVLDEKTGERIRNATVYDPITLQSSVTDEYGFFEIQVKNPAAEDYKLIVNKAEYTDTMLVSSAKGQLFQNILLRLDPQRILNAMDSTDSWKFWKLNKDTDQAKNIENLKDTIHRDFQVSFLPFLGTNRKLSGNVVNDYSLNILGGYSAGTEKAELGGLFNLNRGNVGKFQAAGLFNFNGGGIQGVQLAGLLNMNLRESKGLQAAGLVNFNLKEIDGVQVAPILNATGGNLKGAQISAIANYAHRDVEGTQFSLIFNGARKVKGSQIALFNYSDSIQGIPFGLISIVKKGYHKIELSADEVMPLNVSLRTGTRSFYNILLGGIRPDDTNVNTYTFGYGIGSSPRLGKKTYLNVELSSQQLTRGNLAAINLITRFYLGFEYQITRYVGVFAGPSINWRLYDESYDFHPETFTYTSPKILSENSFAGNNLADQFWIGGRFGVRFF